MKITLHIEPKPIFDFSSEEEMRRWLERHPERQVTLEDWKKAFEVIEKERKCPKN